MQSDLKTLLWLQWKLTLAMFRGRHMSDRLYVLEKLLMLMMFVFTLPTFVVMGVVLAVGMVLLSPAAAYETAMMVNAFLFFLWLVVPASYNSQFIERFEMSRLFPHPIPFRSIVAGSTLTALLTPTGLLTLPILAGELVGLSWHQPLAFPLIALGALPTYALLALTGRVMEDFFDLVAGDRRLTALAFTVLMLPFLLCGIGYYVVQYVTEGFSRLPGFIQWLDRLESVSGPSEFLQVLDASRLLVWLPPGWATAGMGLGLRGEWTQELAFLALSTLFVALLLWAHAGITRRLMAGATLSIGAERMRRRKWPSLPGPQVLWALFYKDWSYIERSPIPRILVLPLLLLVVGVALPLQVLKQAGQVASTVQEALPFISTALVITTASFVVNMTLTGNYFGTIDREGFAVLTLAGLDRRYTLFSANLAVLAYACGLYLVSLAGIALVTGDWIMLPLGLYLGICLQVGGAPAYILAAIIGPYRTQLKFSGGRQQGNLWGMLAWLVSAPPILLLIVLPYAFFKPALLLTLPLCAVCCLGLHAVTLKPLAQLLQRREHAILEAVTTED